MANITLNIEGDLNIYVSEEDGQPDSLYLDGMDGFPETLRIIWKPMARTMKARRRSSTPFPAQRPSA